MVVCIPSLYLGFASLRPCVPSGHGPAAAPGRTVRGRVSLYWVRATLARCEQYTCTGSEAFSHGAAGRVVNVRLPVQV